MKIFHQLCALGFTFLLLFSFLGLALFFCMEGPFPFNIPSAAALPDSPREVTKTTSSEYLLKKHLTDKMQLDTFFSNFSEAHMKSFNEQTLSQERLLNFALHHCYINVFRSLKKTTNGLSVIIPATLIDKVTERYFGKKIHRHQKSEYLMPLADGESYTFSQISRLLQVGKDLFEAEGVIYETGSGGTPDPHGTPEAWKKAGEDVERIGKFSALIKRETERKNCYIFLEYTVIMNKF